MGRRLVVVTLAAIGSVAVDGTRPVVAAPEPPPSSRFVAAVPCRLADARTGDGAEPVTPEIVRIRVTGERCGVPDGASSVALNVTIDNTLTAGPGYASIWPEGQPQPDSSIVNFAPGEVRANGTIVGVGVGGAVDVFTLNRAPVIVDVTGWFEPVASARAGRFVPIAPTRAIDTRLAPRRRPLAAGETLTLGLPEVVPADATAVSLTLTITESAGPGYLTVGPAGTPRPETSAVNADRRGQTRAAGAIVAIAATGLDVFALSGGHVTVDITGWFTGDVAPDSTDGLFVAEPAPRRLLDSRQGDPIWPNGTIEIAAPGAAAAVNVAIVEPFGPSYLTAYPARTARPTTSSVNAVRAGEVAAAMAITPTSTAGIGLYGLAGADTVVDLLGWFTGPVMPSSEAPPGNVRPPECTTDSGPGGLTRFFAGGAAFTGADYQRAYALPDGRTLWLFQDAYVRGRHGNSQLVHNAGLVQHGNCFTVLQTGTFADPGEYLMSASTQYQRHWFWPLSGGIGSDGMFHVFMAEMRENGAGYLTQTEPVATWKVVIDPTTLAVVGANPAPNSSPALYGFSVASGGGYTYLYAHCHRQFGWDPFPFVSPPVYVHDFDCAGRLRVARVANGQFDQAPSYWNGSAWVSNPAAAADIAPPGRFASASQVYFDGGRWVAITKLGDWFGDEIVIDVASRPQGPFTTVRTIVAPEPCPTCNTYAPNLMPYRAPDGSWLIGLSNNVFGPVDLSRYDPTFFTTSPI